MDACQVIGLTPLINDLSTIASIGCVLPTYFLHLRPQAYRTILSLAIVFALSTLAFAFTREISCPYFNGTCAVAMFVPLNVVLVAILAAIRRIARVGLWSTVVLACVIFDWAGLSVLSGLLCKHRSADLKSLIPSDETVEPVQRAANAIFAAVGVWCSGSLQHGEIAI
ncbi:MULTISPECIES: hypothetical protein [unclassified Bradyrhizobium]|uniref:hypothetical protein n=1 Tax=unclassified Bradyrhizobium TaxID=2631580 RepID=UPI001BA640F0|nr:MULTISPECIES: hypothetical protein [unclassified Bradyrhizobium]MBR1203888.1 hypothetical protein [Bradyrhizobium sp. AUGA SZCCT0124]MBR1310226.1 hypothetical protein [Bradyrhizobium sp. AUGA SZCCT0051]MBR1340367.1 hypothetical protein [Bradyrhizobium sp. AUGA SZCCT0105]MBR1354974.1 hypothetical protein [Bradyrhizobium sp. AUGA SZCCT0045]